MGDIKRRRKVINLIALLSFLCLFIVLGIVFRHELIDFFTRLLRGEITQESAKEFMRSFSWKGGIIIGFLSCMQIVIPVLPAEPVQVVAGMAYGLPLGVAVCMAGVLFGNTVMYILYRVTGEKLGDYFHSKINVNLATKSAKSKLCMLVFVLYFLPAIPYGLICFIAASAGLKYWKYLLLTVSCTLPSVVIGSGLGVIALGSSWIVTVIVFVVIVTLLILMFCFRNKLFALVNQKLAAAQQPHLTATVVQQPSKAVMRLSYHTIGAYLRRKTGFRMRKLTKAEREDIRGSVVISNHPSFIDWAYMGLGIYPLLGNFIIARYYFFHKKLSWLLKKVGGFPKSMFTSDIESARNTMRVKKQKGTLCLLPEARLSTVGKFESIQPVTARLIRLMKRPVYAYCLHGSYLKKPKWGDGFRRGGFVEAEFSQVMTAEEAQTLSDAEILERMEAAITYNDFDWLQAHPSITYRAKNMAKGLENILFCCPSCGARDSIETEGDTVRCTACGDAVRVNGRYGFDPCERFQNFQDWYDWQLSVLTKEIDDDYVLTDTVTVKLPSRDGKTFFRLAGEGACTLTKDGFRFQGTLDGAVTDKFVALKDIYRILFGAGEDFEIYDGDEFYYFMPSDLRRCVLWYAVSGILYDRYCGGSAASDHASKLGD